MFVREAWLWCVRRVLSSLAGLDSDFFFGLALQNGKQIFFNRIPQMTKDFVMRECDDIPTRTSLCCDSEFAHKEEFSIFIFLERILEISCRDLIRFTTSTISMTLII
jgi:hypothetical protein